MEEKNRLDAARERVQNKISSSGNVSGSIDDYASENIHGAESIRRNDGSVRYSSSVDDETKPKRRVTKMSRKRYRRQSGAVIVLTLFFAAVIALSVWLIVKNKKNDSSTPASDYKTSVVTTEAAPESAAPESDKTPAESEKSAENAPEVLPGDTVTISNDKVHDGNLILVNYKYASVFPDEDILVPMKERAEHFSVSTLDVSLQSEALDSFVSLTNDLYENSGCDAVLVVSSFRGIEKQREIYQDRLDRYGSEYAAAYVADPGYSEHHTGLAMDLSIYTGGASYDIETYPDAAWFNDNYDKYGYILRYPEHKAGITSINYEGWHYRYVGLPHSKIMDSLDLCLEEYIDYTREHTAERAICYDRNMGTLKEVDAADYQPTPSEDLVYFVPASSGGTTDIPVVGTPYKISGNNVDGFIVTVGE